MIDPLVNDHLDHQAFSRLADDSDFLGHDPLAVDRDAIAKPLKRGFSRPGQCENVILLVEAIPRVHHAVRNIAVIGQEQQALGVAIEPPDGIDPLRHRDEIHHRPAIAFIFRGRDVSARFVEQDVTRSLRLEQFAVDADLRADWVGFRAELRHRLAVDADATFANEIFRGTARTDASRGEDALQPFHGRGVAPEMMFANGMEDDRSSGWCTAVGLSLWWKLNNWPFGDLLSVREE